MEAVLQRTRELHDMLLPILAEGVGDSLQVEESIAPDAGLVGYGFLGADVHTYIRVYTHNDKAASLFMLARIGRCYVQYPRALRWLAANRAGNTVGIYTHTDALKQRELSVCSHRVTMTGDTEGVKEMFHDFGVEVARVKRGMVWFPQLLNGEQLTQLERIDDESLREWSLAVLASRKAYIEWVEKNPEEALKTNGPFPSTAYGWLNRWDGKLRWMHKHRKTLSNEEQDEGMVSYLMERIYAAGYLGRFKEAMFLLDEIESLLDEDQRNAIASTRMAILCSMGQHEEALELTRSAVHDMDTGTWYWRAFAAASLQKYDDAAHYYTEYESKQGIDIIARKKVVSLFPKEWQPAETDAEAA
jgi:tetratricopeptide (TPR) repeat protein